MSAAIIGQQTGLVVDNSIPYRTPKTYPCSPVESAFYKTLGRQWRSLSPVTSISDVCFSALAKLVFPGAEQFIYSQAMDDKNMRFVSSLEVVS